MGEEKLRRFNKIMIKFTIFILVLVVIGLGMIYYQNTKYEKMTKREKLTLNEFIAVTISQEFTDRDKLYGIDEMDDIKRIFLRDLGNFTKDMTVDGMVMQTIDLMKTLSKDKELAKFEGVSIQYVMETFDSYGNSEDEIACIITFMKSTVKKINWDKIRVEDIKKIADTYWLHEGLSE